MIKYTSDKIKCSDEAVRWLKIDVRKEWVMREIKFRFWVSCCETMFYTDANYENTSLSIDILDEKLVWSVFRDDWNGEILERCGTHLNLYKGDAVMQYIGVKDINGKDVYEEDLIEWEEDGKVVLGRVIFNSGSFFIINNRESQLERLEQAWIPFNKLHKGRVVGNMFENRDLLERSE